jgi:hypothetical protein
MQQCKAMAMRHKLPDWKHCNPMLDFVKSLDGGPGLLLSWNAPRLVPGYPGASLSHLESFFHLHKQLLNNLGPYLQILPLGICFKDSQACLGLSLGTRLHLEPFGGVLEPPIQTYLQLNLLASLPRSTHPGILGINAAVC